MQVIGIGIDLVRISRIETILRRWETGFLNRVFTLREQRDCLQCHAPHRHLSGRFAVKEALLKALGTGLRDGIRWQEIETLRTPLGKPVVTLTGAALRRAEALGASEVLASISHDHDYAIGQVVLQGRARP